MFKTGDRPFKPVIYERRSHVDIHPGLMLYRHLPPDFKDEPGPVMVIAKRYVESYFTWEYLIIGPGPTLVWNFLDLMTRVVDPSFEVRDL